MEDKIKSYAVLALTGFVCLLLIQVAFVPALIEQANAPTAHSSTGTRPLLLFLATVFDMRFYIPAGLVGLVGGAGYLACRSGAFSRF